MTTNEVIVKKEKVDNSKCNIVSAMKCSGWSNHIGESNIFFQAAINKKSFGGVIDDR